MIVLPASVLSLARDRPGTVLMDDDDDVVDCLDVDTSREEDTVGVVEEEEEDVDLSLNDLMPRGFFGGCWALMGDEVDGDDEGGGRDEEISTVVVTVSGCGTSGIAS